MLQEGEVEEIELKIKKRKLKRYVYVLPLFILVLVLTAFPLIYSLTLSFHFYDLRIGGNWAFAGLSNYAEALFEDTRFWNSLKNTLTIGVPAVMLQFIIGLGVALLLNRKLVGKRIIVSLLIMPAMISPIVGGLMWTTIYHEKYGALNSVIRGLGIDFHPAWLGDPSLARVAVIFTDTWQWTPLMMMILLAGLQSIPLEPYESAKIDGASSLQIFRYISLPLLRPAILTAILIRAIDHLKLIDLIFVLTRGGPAGKTEIFSYYIYLTGFRYFAMGYSAALSYLLLIITVIMGMSFIKLITWRV